MLDISFKRPLAFFVLPFLLLPACSTANKKLTKLPIAFLDTGKVSVGVVQYHERNGREVNTVSTITRTKSSITTLDTFEYGVIPQGGWTPDARVWITSNDPLPMTVLGYGANLSTSDAQITT